MVIGQSENDNHDVIPSSIPNISDKVFEESMFKLQKLKLCKVTSPQGDVAMNLLTNKDTSRASTLIPLHLTFKISPSPATQSLCKLRKIPRKLLSSSFWQLLHQSTEDSSRIKLKRPKRSEGEEVGRGV